MIWLPMGSEPKDGTPFLCYRDGDIANAWWDGDRLGGKGWSYAEFSMPTHWMDLPSEPSEHVKHFSFNKDSKTSFEEFFDYAWGSLLSGRTGGGGP
jgi:hypothetical protein